MEKIQLIEKDGTAVEVTKLSLIFYRSLDGENDWEPVEVGAIPKFLLSKDIVKRITTGELAQNQTDADDQYWYRAEEIEIH
jgi:hypothetical protein